MKVRIAPLLLITLIFTPFLPANAFAEGKTSGSQLMGSKMTSRGYALIDAENFMQAMPLKDFGLINVHIPYEGEIPGTDANIPYNRINSIVEQFPDKNQTLVLYCRSGSMSTSASRDLVKLGYTNIVELKGGYNAWKKAGGELTQ